MNVKFSPFSSFEPELGQVCYLKLFVAKIWKLSIWYIILLIGNVILHDLVRGKRLIIVICMWILFSCVVFTGYNGKYHTFVSKLCIHQTKAAGRKWWSFCLSYKMFGSGWSFESRFYFFLFVCVLNSFHMLLFTGALVLLHNS